VGERARSGTGWRRRLAGFTPKERIRDIAAGRRQTSAFRSYFPEKGMFSLFNQKKYFNFLSRSNILKI